MTDEFENPLDKIIREARERGDFNELPGKGKPLNWDDDTHVPDEQRMAQRLLKNNGFTLDWIEQGKEMDQAYDTLRATLERARQAYAAGQLDRPAWQSAARTFVSNVRTLNQRITGYNLRVPNERFQRLHYKIDPDLLDV